MSCSSEETSGGGLRRWKRPRLLAERSLSMQFNVTRVLHHLYVGGSDCLDDKSALEAMQISHVINCTTDLPNTFEEDFKYLRVAVADSAAAPLEEYFQQAFLFIDEAQENETACLVHCSHGMSRSTSIVLAYLIERHHMSLREAFEHLRRLRPVTSPNPGFMAKLLHLEKSCHNTQTIDLEKYRQDRFGEITNLIPTPTESKSIREIPELKRIQQQKQEEVEEEEQPI